MRNDEITKAVSCAQERASGQTGDMPISTLMPDAAGKQQFVYSWRLEPGDKLPQGKRDGPALREKARQIKRDLEDGINPRGGEITVSELVEKYLRQRPPVRANTTHVRDFVTQVIERTGFGAKRIDRIKQSDAKEFLIKLQEHGRPDRTGYNRGSVEAVVKILRPAFKMAVNDDLIRKNPFDFKTSDAAINDTKVREALTPEHERVYLEFVKQDEHFSQYSIMMRCISSFTQGCASLNLWG